MRDSTGIVIANAFHSRQNVRDMVLQRCSCDKDRFLGVELVQMWRITGSSDIVKGEYLYIIRFLQ